MSWKTRMSDVENDLTGNVGEVNGPEVFDVQRLIDLEWNICKPWFGSDSFLIPDIRERRVGGHVLLASE